MQGNLQVIFDAGTECMMNIFGGRVWKRSLYLIYIRLNSADFIMNSRETFQIISFLYSAFSIIFIFYR